MKSHKDLEAWRHAIEVARVVYVITKKFPRDERFGLSAQMRRAAVSVASNIAEGAARQTNREFIQFLYIALGSASELHTHIEISKVTQTGDANELGHLEMTLKRLSQMIQGLIRYAKGRESRSTRLT